LKFGMLGRRTTATAVSKWYGTEFLVPYYGRNHHVIVEDFFKIPVLWDNWNCPSHATGDAKII